MKLEYSDVKKTAGKLKFRTQAFIDGKFVHAASGKTYVSTNPATGQPLTNIASREDVNLAVKAARRSFEQGVWSKRSQVELYRLMVETRDFAAARKLDFQMLPLLSLMENGGKYTQWVKAACGLMGRPVGAPRAPLRAATAAELRQLKAALAELPEGRRV